MTNEATLLEPTDHLVHLPLEWSASLESNGDVVRREALLPKAKHFSCYFKAVLLNILTEWCSSFCLAKYDFSEAKYFMSLKREHEWTTSDKMRGNHAAKEAQ